MKCPRCAHAITDIAERCSQCDFHISELGQGLVVPQKPQGWVLDLAQVIDPYQAWRIENRCQNSHTLTGAQLYVVTIPTTAPITPAQHVFWLFNRWDVGGDTNRGLMILLAVQERRIECEVGYALENIVSDRESGAILDALVVPYLARGEHGAGLYHGAAALATLIEGARA